MFDDEEEDNGFFLLVLGVLAAILLIVTVVARGGDDLPDATVTGDTSPETTTTAAPETTTTAAPETTTEAPTTTEAALPEPTTMWDALNGSGQASQFALIGSGLGLRESLEDASGDNRTLFAPSDAALAALIAANPDAIAGLEADPEGTAALVGYHFLPGDVPSGDLAALDGQTITSLTGLPIAVSVVDGEVVLNGTTRVVGTDFTADNGTVHIVDSILTPPTINQVIGLENIEFEVGSAVITAAGQEELQKAVAFFTENPDAGALIEGHTDTDGSDESNQALSQSRAEAVEAFLVENGIEDERLSAIGLGEAQPVLVDGVEDKAASRRIEFEVR